MRLGNLFARGILPLLLISAQASPAQRLAHSPAPAAAAKTHGTTLVDLALAKELRLARNPNHPMRYQLRRSSPRLTTVKDIVETRDGAVARLLSVDNRPLNAEEKQKEKVRLDKLLRDPGEQMHRKDREQKDTGRVLKVLRLLPRAYLYTFVGYEESPLGQLAKYDFKPNPDFDPPDLETRVMTAMSGTLLIDPTELRIVRLEGHLTHDVDIGWGILGRLYKGGWIVIQQAPVGWNQWRIVHFQMLMNGRVLFKSKTFDTTQETSHFAPVPVGLSYVQAIHILRTDPGGLQQAGQSAVPCLTAKPCGKEK